jgi:hypothetical protein
MANKEVGYWGREAISSSPASGCFYVGKAYIDGMIYLTQKGMQGNVLS